MRGSGTAPMMRQPCAGSSVASRNVVTLRACVRVRARVRRSDRRRTRLAATKHKHTTLLFVHACQEQRVPAPSTPR
jgi:hypothetical protein